MKRRQRNFGKAEMVGLARWKVPFSLTTLAVMQIGCALTLN